MEFLNAALNKHKTPALQMMCLGAGRQEAVMKDINGDKRAGYLMGLAQNKVRRHRRGSREEGS